MPYYAFKLLLTAWGLGYIDAFSFYQLCNNFGVQYAGFMLAAASNNVTQIGPRLLLEPILGFRTSYGRS